MTGITITLNTDEVWTLINAHLEAERVHVQKREYADASDEKARAEYLRNLVANLNPK